MLKLFNFIANTSNYLIIKTNYYTRKIGFRFILNY